MLLSIDSRGGGGGVAEDKKKGKMRGSNTDGRDEKEKAKVVAPATRATGTGEEVQQRKIGQNRCGWCPNRVLD